jgi:phosphatidylglycerophosphate synthase
MYKRRFRLAAVMWLFAYYFDCLDGYVARKYKMASKWGSMYDHVSDILFLILVIISIWRINPKLFVWFLVIFIPSWLLCGYFYSLQESYYDNDTHTGLDMVILHSLFPKTSKKNAERKLRYMRYFGPATGIMIIAIFIAMLDKIR